MKTNLNISLLQTELVWEDRKKNLDHFESRILQLKSKTDIILLPETFTSGFSMKPEIAEEGSFTLEWMMEMAKMTNAAIGGSYFVKENGKCYNRFQFVEPTGKVTHYNKKHLFRLTNEHELFSQGDQQVVVDYQGWKISLMVCYDLRFPVWMRRSPENDYDLILLVANWPERRSRAWNQLLIARAIENQAYVAAVNRIGKDGNGILHSGDSVVIDPMGKNLTAENSFRDLIVNAQVDHAFLKKTRENLPFYNDRDSFSL